MSESDSHALARSRQGHAATSGVDRWVAIQENTFRNWVNEQIRPDHVVEVLTDDFDNGIKLCALVEALQRKKVGRVIKNPRNHHQQLENVALALNAIANDNIRLVNIGPEDIVTGNLKLILGLIWHLILRYQIGKSKFPPKKLMICWLQAVIPECNITNFTSCWNDGIALHALIDYCRPGLCPDWRNLSRSDRLDNCRNAMTLAKENFGIPLVVRPEDLSSPDLDELSGMTYLSYFMKLDSPGYHATMRGVQGLIRDPSVTNFTTDWQDGRVLCKLVHSVGGNVAGWPALSSDPVANYQLGISAAEQLGIEQILTAKEMADPEVDHIGIMAYAAYFNRFKPVRSAAEKAMFASLPSNVFVGQETSFTVRLEDNDVGPGDIRADVHGPDSAQTVHFNWSGRSGEGYFTPTETGHHKLNVYCEHQLINGCPASFRVLADRSRVTFTRIDRCTVGMIQELTVDTANAGQGDVQIEARSPSGRVHNLSAVPRLGSYITNFNPSEVGDWTISVMYDGEHISGSPYTINVYDPSQVRVYGLEGGSVGTAMSFHADTSKAGSGDLRCTVTTGGSYVPSQVIQEYGGLYKIDFTPSGSGVYKVEVFYDDVEVRGSPFTMEIVDSSNVTVSGDGLSLVAVNKTACFTVDTHASGGKVDVEIIAPSGQRVPANTAKQKHGVGVYQVEYVPTEAGDHRINVKFAGHLVKGCPFLCKVYDAGKVIVSNMPSQSVKGNPVVFDIDASKAGSGNIEIMVNDGKIACSVQNHGNYRFTASFIPESLDTHTVVMKFNSIPVTGSPWKIGILDPDQITASGSGLEFIAKTRVASFLLNYQGTISNNFNIHIKAPGGQTVPYNIVQDGTEYRVEYTPFEIGDYRIEVKYADREISGSPFIAKAYDTSAIEVVPPKDGCVGEPIDFWIDVTKAGEGQLEIMVNNGNLPNTVEAERTGVYKMSFTPEEAGRQTVEIIFNKEQHPGSPFYCNCIDVSGARVTIDSMRVAVDRVTSFKVYSESTAGSVTVDVISPDGETLPVYSKTVDQDTEIFEFVPLQVGPHTISARIYGKHLDESPYVLQAYSARLVRLSKMPLGILDIPFKFIVMADQAGEGEIQVSVKAQGQNIPNELIALGSKKFEVVFYGHGECRHTINITLNGEDIPDSPIEIDFVDLDNIRVLTPDTDLVPCHRLTAFKLTMPETALKDIHAQIIGPKGVTYPVKIRPLGKNNMYRCDWTPHVAGSYYLTVTYGNIPIWGSPLTFRAYNSNKVRVWLSDWDAKIDEKYTIRVDTDEAGDGELEVVVMCDGQTLETDIIQKDDKLIYCTFVPEIRKRHTAYVTFNKEPVPGSAFTIPMEGDITEVSTAKKKLLQHQFLVQEIHWHILNALGQGIDTRWLIITITAPNGDRINADILPTGSGDYRVEWTPRIAGRHSVNVQFAGREVEGSPFYVDVFDLATIRIDNFRHGLVGDDAGFSVDFSAAGQLEHEIRIESPSMNSVSYDTRELGYLWKDVIFEPEESGVYKIYITYGGFVLPGCPYTMQVEDGGMPTASGDGLYFGEEDKPAVFKVDVGKSRKGDLKVKVDGPNSIAKVSVDPQSDGTYTITYIPVETGIFDVSVTWNNADISGSPFHPKVVDPRKVKVIGGWQHFMDNQERITLIVGEEKSLPFDISEAGPGTLRAEVNGPTRSIPVQLDTHTMGKCVVYFTPEEEGNHYIHLFWSDCPLVGNPLLGYAVPVTMDANKVILTGRGLKEATVREEAEFMIDGSQAGRGSPEVTLSGVRAEINVKVINVGNGRFRCSYIPVIPGAYLLHITWNGRQLRGSPYKVNIIGAFYPNRVIVAGEGLHGGILGREMEVSIDTRKAGPGELTASCMGPHQPAYCELEDGRDGTFRLRMKPQESGRHVMQVKYGGEHVQGSPFILKVMAQPDAGKVRVTGPGVEHGILAQFQSRFIVETRGAGAGQLTVRIRGPKGSFQVEMYRDSQKDRTILCRYDPTECGLYIISIKWSGMDVPGSPFHVHIVDTQQELEQVLNESSLGASTFHTGSTPRMGYSQWRAEI